MLLWTILKNKSVHIQFDVLNEAHLIQQEFCFCQIKIYTWFHDPNHQIKSHFSILRKVFILYYLQLRFYDEHFQHTQRCLKSIPQNNTSFLWPMKSNQTGLRLTLIRQTVWPFASSCSNSMSCANSTAPRYSKSTQISTAIFTLWLLPHTQAFIKPSLPNRNTCLGVKRPWKYLFCFLMTSWKGKRDFLADRQVCLGLKRGNPDIVASY